MSKLARFLVGKNIFGSAAGKVAAKSTTAFFVAWILFDFVTAYQGSRPRHIDLSKECIDVLFVAIGLGTALAGVRLSAGKIQILAGSMLLVWHFALIRHLHYLLEILGNFQYVMRYWQWRFE